MSAYLYVAMAMTLLPYALALVLAVASARAKESWQFAGIGVFAADAFLGQLGVSVSLLVLDNVFLQVVLALGAALIVTVPMAFALHRSLVRTGRHHVWGAVVPMAALIIGLIGTAMLCLS